MRVIDKILKVDFRKPDKWRTLTLEMSNGECLYVSPARLRRFSKVIDEKLKKMVITDFFKNQNPKK